MHLFLVQESKDDTKSEFAGFLPFGSGKG